jgi:hypothetical protein
MITNVRNINSVEIVLQGGMEYRYLGLKDRDGIILNLVGAKYRGWLVQKVEFFADGAVFEVTLIQQSSDATWKHIPGMMRFITSKINKWRMIDEMTELRRNV